MKNASIVTTLSYLIGEFLETSSDCEKIVLPPVPQFATEFLNEVDALAGVMSSPDNGVVKPIIQMLTPIVPWDWPEPAIGTMSYQQYVYADSTPASIAPSVSYSATATSLSRTYRTFLELLDIDKFPLQSDLNEMRTRCKPPIGSPSNMIAPEGWASTPDSTGINRWRMAYGISMTPQQWIAQISGGGGRASQLSLPITSETSLNITDAYGRQQSLSLHGQANAVVISASALTQITVTPGAWFEASMLKLGRVGPFVSDITSDKAYDGMLTGRVSAIIVAYNPSLQILVPTTLNRDTNTALGSATTVEIGGFKFGSLEASSDACSTKSDSPNALYAATAPGAWIVGVSIEAFT